MENIRQAVERARARQGAASEQQARASSGPSRRRFEFGVGATTYGIDPSNQEIDLDAAHLESRRIITHFGADPRSRSFDMLRTQILQAMDVKAWKIVAITSPTAACGKTLTALNLGLSIARQPERSVLLVDLDLQKPQIAACLGLSCPDGLLGVVRGDTPLSSAIVHARVGNQQLMVLPTAATSGSSELMASRSMATMFEDLRRDYQSQIIIVDLPPILICDDVIAILPQVDCVLLVAAVGSTTVAEIEQCNKHLESTEVVRVVLNKVPEVTNNYYY